MGLRDEMVTFVEDARGQLISILVWRSVEVVLLRRSLEDLAGPGTVDLDDELQNNCKIS